MFPYLIQVTANKMEGQAGNDVTPYWQWLNQSEYNDSSSTAEGFRGVLPTTDGIIPDHPDDDADELYGSDSYDLGYEYDYEIDHTGPMIFARGFHKYGVPIIYAIGIPSNLMVLVVLLCKNYRWTPFSISLVTLAVADTLVLISALLKHVARLTGAAILSSYTSVCLATTYIFFIAIPLSNMILAYIMLDRAFAISYPVYSMRKLTKRRIIFCNLGIFVFLAIFYLPVFYAYGLVKEFPEDDAHCWYPVKHEYWADFYFVGWGRALLWNIIPLTVIVVCGVVMIVKLWPGREQNRSINMFIRDTTIMLLTAGICFFLTTVVQTVDELGFPLGMYKENYSGFLANEVMIIMGSNLALINHAVKLLLYCAAGRKFRAAFILTIFRCGKESEAGVCNDQLTYNLDTVNETGVTVDEEGK